MNGWEIEEGVRDYGQRQDPLGEAVRALQSLMVYTDTHSDGWQYFRKPANAAAGLTGLVGRQRDRDRYRYERRAGESEPAEVTAADVRKALTPVKAFRTRQDWGDLDLTDAERAATAAAAARKATADRDARVQALASRFEAELGEALSRDDMSTADIARMLADLATPGTSQDWIARREAGRALGGVWEAHREIIAELEKDPEIKAAHDSIRESMRDVMPRKPADCPNCHGEREWSGDGRATCYFCGQTS
jgi:hypothetical protein